jgi:hypothetical protein
MSTRSAAQRRILSARILSRQRSWCRDINFVEHPGCCGQKQQSAEHKNQEKI